MWLEIGPREIVSFEWTDKDAFAGNVRTLLTDYVNNTITNQTDLKNHHSQFTGPVIYW